MNVLALFKKVTTFIFDIDGVLTDGRILLLENGFQARQMYIRDGFALQLAVKKGYRLLVISGANSPEAAQRLEKLGVKDIHLSIEDKKTWVMDYMEKNKLKKEEVLFMGDDLPDLPAMQAVGLPCCPADAAAEIREAAEYISPVNGGLGCVRDVIEKVLKLNDHWHYEAGISSR